MHNHGDEVDPIPLMRAMIDSVPSAAPTVVRAGVTEAEIEAAYTTIGAAYDLYRKAVPVNEACHADVLNAALLLMRACERPNDVSSITDAMVEAAGYELCEGLAELDSLTVGIWGSFTEAQRKPYLDIARRALTTAAMAQEVGDEQT